MSPFLSLPLWCLLFVLGGLGSLLPRRVELALGRALGRFACALRLFKYKVCVENIERCWPEKTQAERAELLRKNYEHYGILFFEYLHFFSPWPGHYPRWARKHSVIEGLEHWDKALAAGKGVIFVSAHMGFWELTAAAGGLTGRPLTIVTKVLQPAWLHRMFTERRLSTGVKAALHPGSKPAILKALADGETAAFMNDQYTPPPTGKPALFFGAQVNTLAALGGISKATGAPMLSGAGWRDENGIQRVTLEPVFSEGITAEEATQAACDRVERWVRAHPEQWLWMHRRFKNAVWPEGPKGPKAPAAPVVQ